MRWQAAILILPAGLTAPPAAAYTPQRCQQIRIDEQGNRTVQGWTVLDPTASSRMRADRAHGPGWARSEAAAHGSGHSASGVSVSSSSSSSSSSGSGAHRDFARSSASTTDEDGRTVTVESDERGCRIITDERSDNGD
jgi:hypothetical protein